MELAVAPTNNLPAGSEPAFFLSLTIRFLNYNLTMKSVSKKKIATIAIILCFAFLLTLTILTFTKSRKMTDAESIALHDYSNSLINYFDNFKETEDSEASLYQKELAFAIDYFYYSESKTAITVEELKNFLKDNFNVELNTDTIEEDFNDPLLASKPAIYEDSEQKVHIEPTAPSKRERASIPITKYLEQSVKKKGSTFEVTYEKYVIESAYDALNCLSNQENSEESEEEQSEATNTGNVTKMMSYLKAKSPITAAQDAITPECAKELSEPESTITIVYRAQNSKLYIEKIIY